MRSVSTGPRSQRRLTDTCFLLTLVVLGAHWTGLGTTQSVKGGCWGLGLPCYSPCLLAKVGTPPLFNYSTYKSFCSNFSPSSDRWSVVQSSLKTSVPSQTNVPDRGVVSRDDHQEQDFHTSLLWHPQHSITDGCH